MRLNLVVAILAIASLAVSIFAIWQVSSLAKQNIEITRNNSSNIARPSERIPNSETPAKPKPSRENTRTAQPASAERIEIEAEEAAASSKPFDVKPTTEALAAAMAKLRILGETVIYAGTDPNALASESLTILKTAQPDLKTLKGAILEGALQYDLQGLPKGVHGAFMVRKPELNGFRGYDAIIMVPFEEETFIQDLPRKFVRVILTLGVDKDWKIHQYAVNTELPVDGKRARANGLEPSQMKYRNGIAYQMSADGEIYAHRIDRPGIPVLDNSVVLGAEKLSQSTEDNLFNLMLSWAKLAQKEKFPSTD